MKTKYAVAVVATGLGLAATLFAAEKQTANVVSSTLRLKSHGETVAELNIMKNVIFEVTGGTTTYDTSTGRMTSKGDVTIKLTQDGNVLPITVKADEIDELPGKQ